MNLRRAPAIREWADHLLTAAGRTSLMTSEMRVTRALSTSGFGKKVGEGDFHARHRFSAGFREPGPARRRAVRDSDVWSFRYDARSTTMVKTVSPGCIVTLSETATGRWGKVLRITRPPAPGLLIVVEFVVNGVLVAQDGDLTDWASPKEYVLSVGKRSGHYKLRVRNNSQEELTVEARVTIP